MNTEDNRLRLKVLGTRGSVPAGRADQAIFGGATSCYMIQAGPETVFLDAGSGLVQAPSDFPRPPHILLSHLHLDHLLGLGMYPRLSTKGAETVIHVPAPAGTDPAELLSGVFSPPYWPVRLEAYAGNVRIIPLRFPVRIGELTVEGIPGCHPGGSFIIRVSCGQKSIVYASDYEYEETSFRRLAELSKGADLVLYDGQYTSDEIKYRKGFGHSTAEQARELVGRAGARRAWIVHHAPLRSDEELLAMEAKIQSRKKNICFAREGDEIML